jgi:hypothetical protein
VPENTSQASLEERVLTWLSKQGYPFELTVGELLRTAGWEVEYGRLYIDPSTGKTREIDVLATTRYGSKEHQSAIYFKLAIECKTSRDKPWIVFSSPIDSLFQAVPLSLFPGDLAQLAILDALPDDPSQWSILNLGPRLGHGITTAFSEGKKGDPSTAYAAVQGALSAAAALNAEDEKFALGMGGTNFSVVGIVMPLVVLEGSLFEYSINDGDPQLQPASVLRVIGPNPGRLGDASHVTLMTHEGLREHAAQFAEEAAEIAARLHAGARKVVAQFIETRKTSKNV